MSSSSLAAEKSNIDRKRNLGIYYTPLEVAEILAAWAIQSSSDVILEPSFGGCALLASAVARLRALGSQSPEDQFIGYDVDPEAFLHLKKLFNANKTDGSFFQQDFLEANPLKPRASVVIANPPFVSYHRMNKSQRKIIDDWRAHANPPFALTASLWAYFLLHSMSFLKRGGRMAFVLPSAAVSSDYAHYAISEVCANFQKVRIFRIEEQLFSGSGADERTVILLAEGFQLAATAAPIYFSAIDLAELKDSIALDDNKSVLPGSFCAANLIVDSLKEQGLCHALGDIGNISIGEVIGDTQFFVKPRSAWKLFNISAQHIKPLLTRTRQISGLELSDKDVLQEEFPYLLHPKTERGKSVAGYLAQYPTAKRENNVTFAKRLHWYQATYNDAADAFIGSLSHDSPRIVLNSQKISCANGLYKIKLKSKSESRSRIAIGSMTSLFRWSAELHARPMGAGAMKLEPSDVRRLLLPSTKKLLDRDQSKKLLKEMDLLIRQGKISEARNMADKKLLIETNFITTKDLDIIKKSLSQLQQRRHKQKSAQEPPNQSPEIS